MVLTRPSPSHSGHMPLGSLNDERRRRVHRAAPRAASRGSAAARPRRSRCPTVDRALLPIRAWSTTIAADRLSTESTSGRAVVRQEVLDERRVGLVDQPLRLGRDGVEHQRRLARAGHPGDHGELRAWGCRRDTSRRLFSRAPRTSIAPYRSVTSTSTSRTPPSSWTTGPTPRTERFTATAPWNRRTPSIANTADSTTGQTTASSIACSVAQPPPAPTGAEQLADGGHRPGDRVPLGDVASQPGIAEAATNALDRKANGHTEDLHGHDRRPGPRVSSPR